MSRQKAKSDSPREVNDNFLASRHDHLITLVPTRVSAQRHIQNSLALGAEESSLILIPVTFTARVWLVEVGNKVLFFYFTLLIEAYFTVLK